MRNARKYVDISKWPEVARLVEQVRESKVPHVLRRDDEDVAILVPVKAPRGVRRVSKSDYEAFLSSAGGWKDVDTDKLLEDIYEHRRLSVRPPVDL